MENEVQQDELIESSTDSESTTVGTDVETLQTQLAEERLQREEALKEVKTLQIKRQKDKEKFEKASTHSSTSTEPASPKTLEDISSKVSKLEFVQRKREFGYEHNLSPAEVDKIFALNANPTKEFLEDPFVKSGLSGLRAKQRVENAIPSGSGRGRKVNGKTMMEMTDDERRANWSEIIGKR